MKNAKAKNCWDYWDCPKDVKKGCPTYHAGKGAECWLLGASYQPESSPCKKIRGILDCIHCEWYKKMNNATMSDRINGLMASVARTTPKFDASSERMK